MTSYFYFHSFLALLRMGHYADYVWPAYGIALIILVINLVGPIIRLRILKSKMGKRSEDEENTSKTETS
jgi:heme exporter protein CcmD